MSGKTVKGKKNVVKKLFSWKTSTQIVHDYLSVADNFPPNVRVFPSIVQYKDMAHKERMP